MKQKDQKSNRNKEPKKNFVQKPFVALVAVILVASVIWYIEAQKPNIEMPPEVEQEKDSKYPKAQNFIGIERWINSEPLKMEDLKGKVVLVDFWTYTCINCIRTLPYLKEWDKKYRDRGLVIVGVHTPEFEFEKKYDNVLKSVNEYQIKYPVALDNNYATWQVYRNRYWPHKYLVDMDGYIVYDHIGEGNYDETERKIQELLTERMKRLKEEGEFNAPATNLSQNVDFSKIGTPEIYFGYQFTRGNLGFTAGQDEVKDYRLGGKISKNTVYLSGKWKNNADNMELLSDTGEIILVYDAKNVNIVAGANSTKATVMLDNSYLNDRTKGSDIILENNKSIVDINDFKLYNLASASDYGEHFLSVKVSGKGFRIYTFTFG